MKILNFKTVQRSANFADVIQPDQINIIDYLEITDNFFLVAEELSEISANISGCGSEVYIWRPDDWE
jgi:hypothetical protein